MTTKFNGNINMSGNLVATQTWVNAQGFGAGGGGSIDTLADVDTSTSAPSTGQVLKWNGSNWTPQTDSAGSSYNDASVDTHLNQSNPTSGHVLSWNGSDYAWVSNAGYTDADVNTHLNQSSATSNQVLSWSGTDYAWVAQSGNADLNSLSAGTINTQNDSIAFIDADDSNNSKKETVVDFLTAIAGAGVSVSSGQLTAGTANNPGGANTQVQFNDSSSFGGDSDFTYNKTTNTLTVVNLTATNITTTGAGSTTITAGANIELNATNRVLVTDTVFRLASMTTTQRNAVASPVNGDMIYNSTTNQLESYENSAWVATKGTSSGIANVVDDTTPQLGGNLDVNGKKITSVSGGDIDIEPNGTGDVLLGNFKFDADQTVGAGQDNYIMTYDNSTGKISLEANAGGGSLNTAGNTGTGSVALASETLTVTGTTGQINVEAAAFALSFSLDQNINSITSIAFEGATANTNETKLQAVDPTADNTIELPNKSGTIGLIGDTNTHTFVLGANGSSDYTFSDANNHWFPTTENDPILYLRRGETYIFTNNSGGSHPFQIRQSNGGVAYNTGVTSNGAASGNITFKVPMSAPATLYYQCTSHSGMGNTINIV